MGPIPLSDLNHIVGTAGHIDHGKSSLVRALTGTDPDRLPEEQRRGMTIDLGFASWTLPSGRQIGVIDVPGHRRFVRTVIAGAQGIDLMLLVVAATEGVMPQTREHLAICEFLGIRRAVVALTKVDLADADMAAVARTEVEELLAATTMAGSAIIGCSVVTGDGLAELALAVDGALEGAAGRMDHGVPRLFVDRVFTRAGFGPVVTGTLENGALAVGAEVRMLPGGLRGRIRGLQRHGAATGSVRPGMRAAVNVTGIERDALRRGMALVAPATLVETRRMDCEIRVAADAAGGVLHRGRIEVHLGTAESSAGVWLLEGAEVESGRAGFAQIHLDSPLPAIPGDRFVLRRASAAATVGGGVVLDPAPQRHRRRDPAVDAALRHRLEGGLAAICQEELRKTRLGAGIAQLVAATGRSAEEVTAALASLGSGVSRVARLWFAQERWVELQDAVVETVTDYQASEPLRRGMPREQLANRLRLGGASSPVLAELVATGVLTESGPDVGVPGARSAESILEGEAVVTALEALTRRGLDAPSTAQLASLGLAPDLVRLLAAEGRVVRLGDGTVLAGPTYDAARGTVEQYLREHGTATVAELRDRLGATRRVVVPLLERLDADRVTVRAGDVRRLRPRPQPLA